jgi:hypothetical protein
MINYATFDIPKFLDVRSVDILIAITAVVSFAVLFFIYAHNTKTIISPTTGKKVVYKRPSDALPAISLTISILGIAALLIAQFATPLYNDNLMSAKISKDYNVSILAMTKTHNVTVADAAGSVHSCTIGSNDQIKYSLMCAIPGGNMPLDWIMENKGK